MLCEYCGRSHKGPYKYCRGCLDILCEEEYDNPNGLVICSVCGYLTVNQNRTCNACREALQKEVR